MFEQGKAIPTGSGGSIDTYWKRVEGQRTGLIVFFMDGFGPRPALEELAERMVSWGYDVVVPDLYHHVPGALPVDVAAVFGGGDYQVEFFTRINSWTEAMVVEDVEAIAEFVTGHRQEGETLATVGYCLGGRYALTFAGMVPECSFAASVHGASLATLSDQSAHIFAANSEAKIHLSVAGIDPTFPAEELDDVREHLSAAGKSPDVLVHEGAVHGFSFSDLPVFNETARDKHLAVLAGFLHPTADGA